MVALIVMDGYGLDKPGSTNAVSLAKTPNLDKLFATYPTATLQTSGLAVGLPEGQMGNSEVGHLNLGAGRVAYQSLTRIHAALKDGSFYSNEAFLNAIEHVKHNNQKLHIFGLLSDGGVHSHTSHIIGLIDLAKQHGIADRTYVHAFLDGRDVAPQSAIEFLKRVIQADGKIATVAGRFYAMDRDKNYDRIQLAYDAMTIAKGEFYEDPIAGVEASYAKGVHDEFVVPFVSNKAGMVLTNDAVIFANFRPDRAIEISTAFTNPTAVNFDASQGPSSLHYVCMMLYADQVKGSIAFDLPSLDNLYGDVIGAAGMKQLRIAETEKYAHVTFFFDGGVDKQIPGSDRILVNSPKVSTYDLKPEMSAYEVTEKALAAIKSKQYDTMILNFANPDMVGHTGVVEAVVKAVETVDDCVGRVVEAILAQGGVAIVTADHGNAEKLAEEDGTPFTAHTTNAVPVTVTLEGVTLREDGVLADVAPTMLALLGVKQPVEMTGKTLIK